MTRSRSWLFVPANRADRVAKAFASAADAVIMDLEDACPRAEKERAREIVAETARAHGGARCFVRINAATTPLALDDLDAVVTPGVAGVMLPKAARADVRTVDWAMGQIEARRAMSPNSVELIPLVETADGVLDVATLARAGLSRVRRLTFGAGDLTTDLGIRWTPDEAELAPVRFGLVAASRAGGLEPPIDTVWPGIADADGFGRSVERARDLGFAGKLLIHPSQIEAANAALTPAPEVVERATRVLAAAARAEAAGQGAFQIDGRLVDEVGVAHARRVLAASGDQP